MKASSHQRTESAYEAFSNIHKEDRTGLSRELEGIESVLRRHPRLRSFEHIKPQLQKYLQTDNRVKSEVHKQVVLKRLFNISTDQARNENLLTTQHYDNGSCMRLRTDSKFAVSTNTQSSPYDGCESKGIRASGSAFGHIQAISRHSLQISSEKLQPQRLRVRLEDRQLAQRRLYQSTRGTDPHEDHMLLALRERKKEADVHPAKARCQDQRYAIWLKQVEKLNEIIHGRESEEGGRVERVLRLKQRLQHKLLLEDYQQQRARRTEELLDDIEPTEARHIRPLYAYKLKKLLEDEDEIVATTQRLKAMLGDSHRFVAKVERQQAHLGLSFAHSSPFSASV